MRGHRHRLLVWRGHERLDQGDPEKIVMIDRPTSRSTSRREGSLGQGARPARGVAEPGTPVMAEQFRGPMSMVS
jgi:hypothetical protein